MMFMSAGRRLIAGIGGLLPYLWLIDVVDTGMEAEVEVGEGVDITMVTEGEQISGRPDPGPMQEGESSVRLDSNCK